jgi:hypothetical protein
MEEMQTMQHVLRPFATAGVALLGASMVVITPVVTLPALPDIQTSAVQLVDTEADAFAVLFNALDPDAFTNGITAAPTDSIGDLAVSLDNVIDLGGTPYITFADTLATDLLPLLDITSLFSGLTTGIDSLLTDLTNLPDLSTILTDLGSLLTNLPTASDIATDVVNLLTGPSGVLTTIESDITNIPAELLGALTGSGDPLAVIETDLGSLLSTDTTITGDLSAISGDLTTISGELSTILSSLI